MTGPDNDRWWAEFSVERQGRHRFTVQAWVDRFATWLRDLRPAHRGRPGRRRRPAHRGRPDRDRRRSSRRDGRRGRCRTPARLGDGAARARAAPRRQRPRRARAGRGAGRARQRTHAAPLRDAPPGARDRRRPRAGALLRLVRAVPALGEPGPGAPRHAARRDRAAAVHRRDGLRRRSTCRRSTRSGARSARARTTAPTSGAGRPGQPVGDRRARGRAHGGAPGARHARRLRRARRRGARARASRSRSTSRSRPRPIIRASREHPEWFRRRPDGTIQYAENPPKKYQDIYPFDFESDDWRGAVGRAARRRSRSGSTRASRSSASTTRTPRRSRSGSGRSRGSRRATRR